MEKNITKSGLVIIDRSPLRNSEGVTSRITYYKSDCGRKFKIRYDMSNGTPMGFNYKKSASEFYDGKWHHIDEIKNLRMTKHCSNYYDHEGAYAEMLEFFRLMSDRIVNFYL